MLILIDTIPKVNEFCNIANGLKNNTDVLSDRYRVNAKSLLGLYSLDLSKPVTLKVHESDEEIAKSIFAKFEVKECQ